MKLMGSSYERLLRALPEEPCASDLCERVVDRIFQQRVRIFRTRLVLSSLLGVGSLMGVVGSGVLFVHAAVQSGFAVYASLLISDSGVVEGHMALYALLLLESLPIPETVLTLLVAAALLTSIRGILRSLPRKGVAQIFAPVAVRHA